MASLSDDRRLLVISHMPLAYAMAWRMKDCGVSLDDLRQEGCLGLCEAAMRFSDELGCRFATYASHWCRKMMLRAIRRSTATCSLEDETLREKDEDDDPIRHAQHRRIDDALLSLNPQQRMVVMMYYGIGTNGHSLTEIATQAGISIPRASTIHRQALKRLRTALNGQRLADYITPSGE